jgi:hypothetical protein
VPAGEPAAVQAPAHDTETFLLPMSYRIQPKRIGDIRWKFVEVIGDCSFG